MTLHEELANSHPRLKRGYVWCRTCGAQRKVDSAECFRSGWPVCCGETMTIDSPDERKAAGDSAMKTALTLAGILLFVLLACDLYLLVKDAHKARRWGRTL